VYYICYVIEVVKPLIFIHLEPSYSVTFLCVAMSVKNIVVVVVLAVLKFNRIRGASYV
jgi:hypothetical protein